MSHEMEIFLFKNHYPTSNSLSSISIYNKYRKCIIKNIIIYIKGIMQHTLKYI